MNPTDNQLVRFRVEETDDSKTQQRMKVRGRKREAHGGAQHKVVRAESHGFRSHPPKGSQGFGVMIGGNPDQTFLFGMEKPDDAVRPKDLGEGEAIVYFDKDRYVHIKQDQMLVKHPGTIIVQADTVLISGDTLVHINPPE